MKTHKTPKEMDILITKLNKGEIEWDGINQELEIMRKQSVKAYTNSNTLQKTLDKVKRAEKV